MNESESSICLDESDTSICLNGSETSICLDSSTSSSRHACTLGECGKTFSSKTNLNKHLRRSHGFDRENETVVAKIQCKYCRRKFSIFKQLREHLAKSHGLPIHSQQLSFKSIDDFKEWKELEEKRTISQYVQDRGKRTLASGATRVYYRCHRSGQYISEGKGKKFLKTQGSCKTGTYCPADMLVTIASDSTVQVVYHDTHYGHGLDVGHMRLTRAEREEIAAKLKQGLSFNAILDSIRNERKFDDRMFLLTKKDLHNIRRCFGLSKADNNQAGPKKESDGDTGDSFGGDKIVDRSQSCDEDGIVEEVVRTSMGLHHQPVENESHLLSGHLYQVEPAQPAHSHPTIHYQPVEPCTISYQSLDPSPSTIAIHYQDSSDPHHQTIHYQTVETGFGQPSCALAFPPVEQPHPIIHQPPPVEPPHNRVIYPTHPHVPTLSLEDIHQNSTINSLDSWVSQVRQSPESDENKSIIFYKKHTEEDPHHLLLSNDFLLVLMSQGQRDVLIERGPSLICVDSIRSSNVHDVNLTTLFTVDEYGEAFPLAFCLSNKIDLATMTVFFRCVKDVSSPIYTDTFISDDNSAYWTAWTQEMGTPSKKFLSSWCVDRDWRHNLQYIKTKAKQVEVYKTLRKLLEESNEEAFQETMSKFVNCLKEDEETMEFSYYFMSSFAARPREWAYCYRPENLQTSKASLDGMHRVLKKVYFEGKTIKSIDKGISFLMKLVRDKMHDKALKLLKGKVSRAIKNIRIRHRKALCINAEDITQLSDAQWFIKDRQEPQHQYIVQKTNTTCHTCKLVCSLCFNFCVHMFSCTCLEGSSNTTMCEHVHAVIINFFEISNTIESLPSNMMNVDLPDCDISFEDEELSYRKTAVVEMCHNIVSLWNTKTPTVKLTTAVTGLLNKVIHVLNTGNVDNGKRSRKNPQPRKRKKQLTRRNQLGSKKKNLQTKVTKVLKPRQAKIEAQIKQVCEREFYDECLDSEIGFKEDPTNDDSDE